MAVRVSKAEWVAQRLAGEQARGLFDNIPKMTGPKPPNPFGREGSLAKQLDKDLQRQVNQAVADRAPKGSTLHANIDSDCFVSVIWKDGIATAEFYRGGAIVYDYELSKSEFVDWVSSGSLGQWFNENLR